MTGTRGSFATWVQAVACARVAAGPLVLAGFFLPWAHGPGLLAANEFTGFELVAFTGRLQQLDLSIAAGATLTGIRLALLLVAVAATWLTLLGPKHAWHPAYAVAGWYVLGLGLAAGAVGLWRAGLVVPPAGLALWLVGSLAFAVAWEARRRQRQVESTRLVAGAGTLHP